MLGYFVESKFEVSEGTSEAAIRVLNQLAKHKAIEYVHDDSMALAVRLELIRECEELEILCVEEPYRLILVYDCKKVDGSSLPGLPEPN